jgi:hypothetical protein
VLSASASASEPPSDSLGERVPVVGPLVFKDVHFKYPTRPDFTVFDGLDLEVTHAHCKMPSW